MKTKVILPDGRKPLTFEIPEDMSLAALYVTRGRKVARYYAIATLGGLTCSDGDDIRLYVGNSLGMTEARVGDKGGIIHDDLTINFEHNERGGKFKAVVRGDEVVHSVGYNGEKSRLHLLVQNLDYKVKASE